MTSVSDHTFSALQVTRGYNTAVHGIVTALLLGMNANIDLLALFAEVSAPDFLEKNPAAKNYGAVAPSSDLSDEDFAAKYGPTFGIYGAVIG